MSKRNEILNLLEDYWDQSLASAVVRESLATKVVNIISAEGSESESKEQSQTSRNDVIKTDDKLKGIQFRSIKNENEIKKYL